MARSVDPPAGQGTISVTGFGGNVCARAAPARLKAVATAAITATVNTLRLIIVLLWSFGASAPALRFGLFQMLEETIILRNPSHHNGNVLGAASRRDSPSHPRANHDGGRRAFFHGSSSGCRLLH
jgi:hypothetical protein